jgi:diacylglycerol kinase family enzyme
LDLLIFGQILLGNIPLNSDDVEILSFNKAMITTNIPVSFQMDGEYCGTETELKIKIGHKQLKVAI